MRCEFGYCIVCDKEIAKKCDNCSTKWPTGDYTEVQLNWSNGSRMNMACCLDCSKDKIWKADKQALTQAVWNAWEKLGHSYDEGSVIVD